MNKKQYNNVIDYTLKHEQTEDSLGTARAIFNNMGVALPQGDIKTVYDTIKTNKYMSWKSCTMQEAQAAADNGMAAIGIGEDRIVVLSATDEEQPVTQTASVMTLNENTSAYAVSGLEYYTYGRGVAAQGVCGGNGRATQGTSVTSVTVNPSSITMTVGSSDYLCATVCPINATNKCVKWSSNKTSVATVNPDTGYVIAQGVGTAIITATTVDGGLVASCAVKVCKLKIYQTKETFKFDEKGCLAEDLEYNDISTGDFNEIENIDWSDYDFEDATKLRDKWESLCKLTSTQPLQNVVLDMVDHFMEGTGQNFSNDTLTSKVQNHKSTEEYVEVVKTKLNEVLTAYNGNISTFKYDVDERENNPFIKKLKGTNQPVFNEFSDYINGLVVCLHGIWGNQIEVKSYMKNGNTYSGVLTFTLYDHFGLDEADVVKFEKMHKGFGSWYILQHSRTFSGEYKPFVTVIEFDVEFSGTI